ncbi:C40 family peptidase [Pedobacter flavus]|uniref:C40 family peptidase n=1 Tax=Pedobacter flavus TaxID=3113906 RepID=A0ABU7H3P2_9SPHI|nr:C40 family peptidase [Pedobacter sp. VNH31]MEE1885952.1 C40 family peptidase [Pedobacter sp. VNH31]
MDLVFGICNIAVAPLRSDKSDRAEMVSQLLFGDFVEVLGVEDNWCLVENAADNYQGWMDFKQLTPISEKDYILLKEQFTLAPLQFDNVIKCPDGSIIHLNPGSNLPFFSNATCILGDATYSVEFTPLSSPINSEKIETTAKFFLNAPYLWGGRNILGIDCSGFTQVVFKLHGINLKRDASMQAENGELVAFLTEGRLGDLAFFDNEEGKITHVGILLNNHEIIHASGKVRIDPIDDQGIYNKDLGKYTHKLRIIRRMF